MNDIQKTFEKNIMKFKAKYFSQKEVFNLRILDSQELDEIAAGYTGQHDKHSNHSSHTRVSFNL